MADSKITALTALTAADPANDMIPIVDVSDTPPASGNTKRISINNILACSPTATLASATITGDLTVDTSTLKVDSTNNRVGIVNASPAAALDIVGGKDSTNTIIGAPLSTVGGGSFANYSELLFKNTSGSNSDASIRSYGNVWNAAGSQLAFFTSNNSAVTERYRIDNTGVSTWSVGGSTAMTLNSTGLGVGVASPAFKIHANGVIGTTNTFGAFTALQTAGGTGYRWTLANDNNFYLAYSPDGFGSTSTNRIALDSSGNVGVGVVPSAWGAGTKALEFPNGSVISFAGYIGTVGTANSYYNGSNFIFKTAAAAARYDQDAGQHKFYRSTNVTPSAGGIITFEQAMTLDASGNLLVGKTSTAATVGGGVVYLGRLDSARDTGDAATFKHTTLGNTVGSISITSVATAYNTSSDYRLKESVKPISGGLARINALKPSIYNWKSDGSTGEGFLAHELAEVVPLAVSGEKDAVNEDGSIKTQGVDLSKIVPILVAAIQELTAEVNALKNA
jgi:hypothetical protein